MISKKIGEELTLTTDLCAKRKLSTNEEDMPAPSKRRLDEDLGGQEQAEIRDDDDKAPSCKFTSYKRIYQMSLQKLKRVESCSLRSEPELRRSVLIYNTLRKIEEKMHAMNITAQRTQPPNHEWSELHSSEFDGERLHNEQFYHQYPVHCYPTSNSPYHSCSYPNSSTNSYQQTYSPCSYSVCDAQSSPTSNSYVPYPSSYTSSYPQTQPAYSEQYSASYPYPTSSYSPPEQSFSLTQSSSLATKCSSYSPVSSYVETSEVACQAVPETTVCSPVHLTSTTTSMVSQEKQLISSVSQLSLSNSAVDSSVLPAASCVESKENFSFCSAVSCLLESDWSSFHDSLASAKPVIAEPDFPSDMAANSLTELRALSPVGKDIKSCSSDMMPSCAHSGLWQSQCDEFDQHILQILVEI